MDTLLQTKLHTPQPSSKFVNRPRLAQKLDAGLSGKVTLVSAPAGYGKSTLISNWVAGRPEAAWLSLDQGDNEPRVFWQYVITAMQKVEEGFGAEALQVLRSKLDVGLEQVMVNVLNHFSEASLEFTLVLEDYHVIDSQEVHESLNFFIEHLPSKLHLVLITRVDPPLSLGRLRANSDLSEIRLGDLQFSEDETADFLDRVMKIDLEPDQIKALSTRTEGWVAGIQMAGLSLRKLEGPELVATFVEDFSGSHRHIYDYLADEVLTRQSPEIQTFLLQTSLLDRFNASLANAVTGIEDSQSMLEYLESSNLFLVPLDEDRRWYRFHHLFATLLRRRLKRHSGLIPEKLHLSAADWFEANGMIDQAIQHLRDADNVAELKRMITAYGADALQPGQLNRLQNWLEIFPAQVVQDDAHLASLQAWIYYFEQKSDLVTTWVSYAQNGVNNHKNETRQNRHELDGTILGLKSWAACQDGNYQDGVQLAEEALNLLADTDHTVKGMIYVLLAEALAGLGRPTESIAAYEKSLQFNQEAGNWVAMYALVANIWMTEYLRGHLTGAKQKMDRVIASLTDSGKSINALTLRMARLVISYEQNELIHVGDELTDIWKYIQYDTTIEIARYNFLLTKYHTSMGKQELAYNSAQKLEEAANSWSTPDEKARAIADCMRMYLRLGEHQKPAFWLRSVEYDLDNLSLLRNDEYLAVADVLRFNDSPEARQEGVKLTDAMLKYCDELQIFGIKIEVYCLKALLLAANDDMDDALVSLEQGLEAGEPEGYIRTFLDFGQPMVALLTEAASREIHAEYARFLLTEFSKGKDAKDAGGNQQDLIDPLSDRELEVLALMRSHLSGPEIAARLHISHNTFKTHSKNIYGKLSVQSRNEAVTKAQDLNLL